MKKLKQNFDYLTIIKYLLLFIGYILFNNITTDVSIFSISLFSSSLCFYVNFIPSALLLILSFLIFNKIGLLLAVFSSSIILTVVTLIYKKFKIKPSYEITAFTLVSLCVYIFIGDTVDNIPIDKRIITSLLTTLLTFLTYSAINSLSKKGLKFKPHLEEAFCVFIFVICLGLGICNLLFAEIYFAIAIFSLLLFSFIYRIGIASLISLILAIPLAVYYGNVNYISLFLIYSIFSQCAMPLNRHLSSFLVILSDVVIQLIFNFYGEYNLLYTLPIFIGAVLFSAIPTKPLLTLKENLYSFREKQLTRLSINRNRIMLSNNLYNLSNVFLDISVSLDLLKEKSINENRIKLSFLSEITNSVCKHCENFDKCNNLNNDKYKQKMINIGLAKGKLSLIDFPTELAQICSNPNNLLFGLNKLLTQYADYSKYSKNVLTARELIKDEAVGISALLKEMAFKVGQTLKYQSRLERQLSNNLYKFGFLVDEILIYGEANNVSVSMIVLNKQYNLTSLNNVVNKTLNKDMMLTEKNNLSDDKFFLVFSSAPSFDAVFGIASEKKDTSSISGDTHSIIRISENKFLVALSDGMGSGEKAENISSIALSLIESFYKANLNNSLVLDTVNKLLSFNEEDNFTALDIAVIDLTNQDINFIKYGSPYGFIISKNGIKIVEGNNLPLGILSELRPSTCKTKVENGDIILLITDGVSDAFKDSTKIIDFLRSEPCFNPQTLANNVIKKAVSLSDGKKNDDLTALAIRVFKREKTI